METLKPPKGAIRQRKRLGRGNGSGNGTTAGKGTKGQNSRSGGGVRPGFEGGQMPLYRRVARRGFSNYPFKKEYVAVSLSLIEDRFSSGDTVNLETLRDHRLIGKRESLVKILCDGEVSKKLTVVGVRVSRSAAAKIVAAGGTVDNIAGKESAQTGQDVETKPKEKAALKAEAKSEPKKKAAVAKAPAKTPAESNDPAVVDAKDSEPDKVSAPKKSAPRRSAPKQAEKDGK